MNARTTQVIIFAREPVAGQCKTRLIPLLGAEGAKHFHQQLIHNCLNIVCQLSNIDLALYIYPFSHNSFFNSFKQDSISLFSQQGSDLGERMLNAMQASLKQYDNCIIIGTDCPAMSANYILKAIESLQSNHFVFGPARDGGYVLIGSNTVHHALFEDIDWGTSQVLEQSLGKLQPDAYNVALLDTLWDIDTPDDFITYQNEINHLLSTRYQLEHIMDHHHADKIRNNVRDSYSKVAEANNEGDCCGVESSCCGVSDDNKINQLISTRLGYSADDLNNVPEGADMGLGCGNPKAIAALKNGETVIDLGSGGGFDAFLAANEIGDDGRVIGIDMTPEMISKARNNAAKANYKNVEFRLGEIEHLPVADNSADVIISNCVINLSPNKQQVFNDAYRALKPGGRLAISDIVSSTDLPDEIKNDTQLYSACVSGASSIHELEEMMKASGFKDISIEPKDESREFIKDWAPGSNIEDFVISAYIQAYK